nr:immunoglobulin light chain junction region [Macaca mulatta]MOX32447.1 immunoglobulin light chain junction region [Macaca mulatta]
DYYCATWHNTAGVF